MTVLKNHLIYISLYANVSNMTNYEPMERQVIRDNVGIRAYAHPVRLRMLELLGLEALTLSMTAKKMDTHPANLTRHMRCLVQAGLAYLVKTRDTGRNLEKFYRASALSYTVSYDGHQEDKTSIALGILRENLEWAENHAKDALALLVSLCLKDEDLKELENKLESLVDEFRKKSSDEGDSIMLNIAVYPGEGLQGHLPKDKGEVML